MKLDTGLYVRNLREVPALARAAEEAGYAGLWTVEAGNDGLLPLTLAAEHTRHMNLGTAVVVAFPRSPMAMAYASWDLARFSEGRFILGLGTQVKGHIERRFSVPWLPPAARLREYVESMRAIFACWREGKSRLSYQGKYYQFSLMTPAFSPPRHDFPIPIYIAGVNKMVCELAGELCDGFHVHPLHSVKYLREHVLPNIEAGLAKAGRRRADITLVSNVFAIVGANDQEVAASRESARTQIAFYASTRTYTPVLEAHGWSDVVGRLNERTRKGDWKGMPQEITDEMLEVFAVSGTYDNIAERVKARYGDLLDRVMFYFPFRSGAPGAEQPWHKVVREFNG